jgi:hypothetical protein
MRKRMIGLGRDYGMPPRLPATRGKYEIAVPDGSVNASLARSYSEAAETGGGQSAQKARVQIGHRRGGGHLQRRRAGRRRGDKLPDAVTLPFTV